MSDVGAGRGGGGGRRPPLLLVGVLVSAWALVSLVAWSLSDASRDSALVFVWVALMVVSGGVFALLCPRLGRVASARWLWCVVIAGVVMRAASLTHAPVFEDDYHRYLLDGAMTAHALDPFAVSPEALLAGEGGAARQAVIESSHARQHVALVNHPHLRTIYPPVAQAAFAAAYAFDPWSVSGLRAVLLIADVCAAIAVGAVLRLIGMPLAFVGVYWLNPIVVGQVVGQAHMDVLAYMPVMAAVWARLAGRHRLSAVLLALAVGAKVWPVLLAPLLLSPLIGGGRWRTSASAAMVFILTSGVLLYPALSAFGQGSGVEAYARSWENNAMLYPAVQWAVAASQGGLGWDGVDARAIARGLAAALVAFAAMYAARKGGTHDIPRRALVVIATLFFLSPTQFPWYLTWLAPFLAFVPGSALRLSVMLLPLYHLGVVSVWMPVFQHAPPLATAAFRRVRAWRSG